VDLSFSILYHRDEAGWWIAEIPEIPGAFSQGKTELEARAMVLDAVNELTLARRAHAIAKDPPVHTESFRFAV
jgi:predicted RNase H-like HicB family nuclease